MLARYVGLPTGYTHLAPAESDTLTLQVDAAEPAEIRFDVLVSYRLDDADVTGTVVVPTSVVAAFGDNSSWRPYHVDSGHLVAGG